MKVALLVSICSLEYSMALCNQSFEPYSINNKSVAEMWQNIAVSDVSLCLSAFEKFLRRQQELFEHV